MIYQSKDRCVYQRPPHNQLIKLIKIRSMNSPPLMPHGFVPSKSMHGSYAKESEDCLKHGKLHKTARHVSTMLPLFDSMVARYFVLKNGELMYYDSNKAKHPKMAWQLNGAEVLPFVPTAGHEPGFVIIIGDESRYLYGIPSEIGEWLAAFKSCPGVCVSMVPIDGPKSLSDLETIPTTAIKRGHRSSLTRAVSNVNDVYVINEELGQGVYGVVYRGVDRFDGSQWALKQIDIQHFNKHKEQQQMEVLVLASLRHENIVQVREALLSKSHFTIVMELLSGKELFDRILERHNYTEDDARFVVQQLLSGLSYLHANDVVHRDLKPENLIFKDRAPDAWSCLKITDFGFATLCDHSTRLTAVAGTPLYIAPEILQREPYGLAVDMWSLGVITYVLLSGHPPFWDSCEAEMDEQICACRFDFNSPGWESVSDDAKDFISTLLTLDPQKRPTAQQALEHAWIREKRSETKHLGSAIDELKRFRTFEKFRRCVHAVVAYGRVSAMVQELLVSRQYLPRYNQALHSAPKQAD